MYLVYFAKKHCVTYLLLSIPSLTGERDDQRLIDIYFYIYKKARKCADLELLRTTYPKDDDDAGILYAAFFRLLDYCLK